MVLGFQARDLLGWKEAVAALGEGVGGVERAEVAEFAVRAPPGLGDPGGEAGLLAGGDIEEGGLPPGERAGGGEGDGEGGERGRGRGVISLPIRGSGPGDEEEAADVVDIDRGLAEGDGDRLVAVPPSSGVGAGEGGAGRAETLAAEARDERGQEVGEERGELGMIVEGPVEVAAGDEDEGRAGGDEGTIVQAARQGLQWRAGRAEMVAERAGRELRQVAEGVQAEEGEAVDERGGAAGRGDGEGREEGGDGGRREERGRRWAMPGGEAGDAGGGRDTETGGGVAPLARGGEERRADTLDGGTAPTGAEIEPAAVGRVGLDGGAVRAEGVEEGGPSAAGGGAGSGRGASRR